MSLATRITQALIDEGWTCYSTDPDEAELLPGSAVTAVERILSLAATLSDDNAHTDGAS